MCEYRAATINDFSEICGLVENEDELFWVWPGGRFPLTVEQMMKLSKERADLTVVVEKGKIIGFADFYNYLPGQSAYIGNVIVAKGHRGKGIGRNLVLYMLQRAGEVHQLEEVRISVFNENTPALMLYSALGFMPYEVEERISPKGKRVALVHMKVVMDDRARTRQSHGWGRP